MSSIDMQGWWQLLTFQSIQRTKEQSCIRIKQSQEPFFQGLQPLQLKQFWKIAKMLNKNHSFQPGLEMTTLWANALTRLPWITSSQNASTQPLLSVSNEDPLNYLEPSNPKSTDGLLSSEEEVHEIIMSSDTSKANWPDGMRIPAKKNAQRYSSQHHPSVNTSV